MSVNYVGNKKCTTETSVRAFEYFAFSSAAYDRLREAFELPNVRTFTRLTSKAKTIDDSS